MDSQRPPEPAQTHANRRWWGNRRLLIGLMVILLLGGGFAVWHSQKSQTTGQTPAQTPRDQSAAAPVAGRDGKRGEGRPLPVAAQVIERTSLPERIQVAGTLTALNTVVVRPRVDGVLQRVLFKEGDRVAAGDALAQIDPQPYEVAVRSAEGAVERDRATLRNAELDLQRFEDLWQKESISRQQLDAQRALVQQLKGTVQSGQAALDAARMNLGWTTVRAPMAGRLGLRQIDAGNVVRASDATGLVTLTQDDPIAVVFSVADVYVSRLQSGLKRGQALSLEVLDRTGLQVLAQGRLQSSDNAIDVATGTLRLKGQVSNSQQVLFPNQFVTVRMQLGIRKDVLVAPVAAVQRGGDGTFVYVVEEDQTVRIQPVRVGVADGERVEVEALDGELKPGMAVVTQGTDRLRAGSRVEVIEPGKTAKDRSKRERRRGADVTDKPSAGPSGKGA